MNRVPTVSVILATRNRGQLLQRSLMSVINQSHTDFEVLVVDDASTDDTEIIAKGFKDDRIRYIRLDRNVGAAAARNRGIQRASGDLIAFQDSSDEWLPSKLVKQIAAFSDAPDGPCVVYTGSWRENNGDRTYIPSRRIKNRQGDIHDALLWGNFVDTPSLLVKREWFDKAGMFDERLPRFQDWELCLRLSKFYRFNLVDEPLFIAHCQSDSISSNSGSGLEALKLIFDEYYEEISREPRLLAHYYHWMGACLFENSQKKAARDYLRKAIGQDPLHMKYRISFILSFLGVRVYNAAMAAYQRTKR